jgi:hypothetical protein
MSQRNSQDDKNPVVIGGLFQCGLYVITLECWKKGKVFAFSENRSPILWLSSPSSAY